MNCSVAIHEVTIIPFSSSSYPPVHFFLLTSPPLQACTLPNETFNATIDAEMSLCNKTKWKFIMDSRVAAAAGGDGVDDGN